jgi:site-specific recombinase XerD
MLAVWRHTPGPLFLPLSKAGNLQRRRLSDKAVTWILHSCAKAAGVMAFSPHDLRRTFISTLRDASVDLATVAEIAGHAKIATTRHRDALTHLRKGVMIGSMEILRSPHRKAAPARSRWAPI